MKAQDIRIGNLLTHTNENGTFNIVVKEILESGINTHFNNGTWFIELDNIKPIPLTEEILLKSGFGMRDDQYFLIIPTGVASNSIYLEFEIAKGDVFGSMWIDKETKNTRKIFLEIQCIHQLQNLFFALTGEEIKIEL